MKITQDLIDIALNNLHALVEDYGYNVKQDYADDEWFEESDERALMDASIASLAVLAEALGQKETAGAK